MSLNVNLIIGTIAKCMRIILDIFIGSDPEIRHSGYQRVVTASLPVFICISDADHNQYDENDCAYSKNKFHADRLIISDRIQNCLFIILFQQHNDQVHLPLSSATE
jgi:hypothetical protein